MLLSDVLGDVAPSVPLPPVEVTALAFDDRAVVPGTVFFCVPGFTRDGHDFAPAAVERGAVALVVERPLGLGVPEAVVGSVRAAMGPAAARFYGEPTASLRVVGITGTNGKTTSAFVLRGLLEAAGIRTGLLGTVTAVVGGEARSVARTTPEAIELHKMFREMLDAGDAVCAMEVSSHALELGRAGGINWAVAVFTNLTQDHLDFHQTMENYYLAKRRLFVEGRPGAAVVNLDDEYGRRLAAELGDAVTVGIESAGARLRATHVETGFAGSSFRLDGRELHTSLPGRFNVLNVLGAIGAARELGVDDDTIVAALPRAARVPGRFEPVDEGQDFAVLVDYAHTPDSLENVLRAARELTPARVVCLFGCGGDRDRGKRPLMGAIARDLADTVIVTSDNPRSEDPEAIIAQIVEGAGPGAEVVVDRRAAIQRAIEAASGGDVVVIAGKGHEQGQEFAGGRTVPFDDVTVAREALRGAAAGAPGR